MYGMQYILKAHHEICLALIYLKLTRVNQMMQKLTKQKITKMMNMYVYVSIYIYISMKYDVNVLIALGSIL